MALATACFVYSPDICGPWIDPRSGTDPYYDRFLYDKPTLYGLLGERGIGVVMATEGANSFRAGSASSQITVEARHADAYGVPGLPVEMDVAELGIVVNRARQTRLDFNNQPPVINQASVATLGNDKERVHNTIFEPNGMGIPTYNLEQLDNGALAGVKSLVVKRRAGNAPDGVLIVGPDEAREIMSQLDSDHIAQPYVHMSGKFPRFVRPYSAQDAELFDAINQPGRPKELRMYNFWHNAGGQEHLQQLPAVRVSVPGAIMGEATWTACDPEALPPELYEQSAVAFRSIARATGAKAIYGSVDWGFDGNDGSAHAVESNMYGPFLIGRREHEDVGLQAYTAYADLLTRAATAR
ncbi:MAG TPA: hypothetical protein VF466_01680 [Candidatus Saccharimonadales bacterium]